MDWSTVKLTDAQITKGDAFRLQTQFETIFATALAPSEAAMFGNLAPVRDNHLFYFSPKASEIFAPILARWNPYVGDAPIRESVALLVGHAHALSMLVPTGQNHD